MQVNFLDLKKNYLSIENEIMEEFNSLFDKCDFILGKKVEIFEKNFANYIGIKNFIGCANGTDALEVAVKSFDLKQDDEVIVQGNTYIATCLGVLNNNLKLVLCDINPETHMIDINKLKDKITTKTKLIIVVHLYGLVPDMDKIVSLCKDQNIYLIEDCAQAHGAYWKNKRVGTFGDLCCFSFYPGKNLGAYGDGGGIGTNLDEANEKIRKMMNLGCKIKYHHELIGRNSRLDTLQASFLNVKLKYLESWNEKRRYNANLYNKYLTDNKFIHTPVINENCTPVYHLYVIRTKYRDNLKEYLDKNKIQTLIHYPISIAETDALKEYNFMDIENCIQNSKDILSLPMYPELTEDEIKYVCSTINNFFLEVDLLKLDSIQLLNKPGILHCINNLSFNTKRLFYLDSFGTTNNFEKNNKRGFHANINFDELIIVLNGEIKVKLTDKNLNVTETILNKNDTKIIPRMNWLEYEMIDISSIILVLANEIFGNSISVRDYETFIKT
jgi:dTDP-4-amino-4,6-dideoxygalactose transaminase